VSMQDLTDALVIVEANRGRSFFAGARDPALIAAAESVLGVAFPPTYRAFLEQLGAGNFGSFEIYGVTNDNFENGRVPNGIWLTLKQRRANIIPDNFIIIGASGDGGYYGLALREGDEAPVVLFYPGVTPAAQLRREVVATDFAAYFSAGVREEV
jgi:antitoxin YobK